MAETVEKLKKITREYQLISEAAAILGWDQETYIPQQAIPERGEQLALLQSLAHEKITAPEVGELLEQAGCTDVNPWGSGEKLEGDGPFLRELYRRYTRDIRIPSSLVAAFARVASAGQAAWVEARRKDDFSLFRPHLEEIVKLNREKAEAVGYDEHPYDALLDEFEPWMTTAKVDTLFTDLEKELSSLVAEISSRKEVDDSFLHRKYEVVRQREFSRRVVEDLGYDFSRGRIDETAHPFTTTLGGSDVRITGRFREDFLATGLFGLVHECGHALYEMGFDPEVQGNILATGTSLGIHESQSRTWENAVARSREFWKHYLPELKNVFPEALNGIDLDSFYRGVNRVAPTFIRIDADEVTYGLHIILRFRLEIAMLTGDLPVADLPGAWRDLSTQLLGITPEKSSDAELQDIHWSMGALGYFPTYALGNLYGAQFQQAAESEIPQLKEKIAGGDFTDLALWLRKNIHAFGASRTADEICVGATRESLKAEYFLTYLKNKYGEIYNI